MLRLQLDVFVVRGTTRENNVQHRESQLVRQDLGPDLRSDLGMKGFGLPRHSPITER